MASHCFNASVYHIGGVGAGPILTAPDKCYNRPGKMTKIFAKSIATALLVIIALGRAAPALASAEGSTVTLTQCYQWALQRSEDLKSREEDIEQARLRARGAMAGVYPSLAWEFVDIWQDPGGVNKLNAQGFGGFVQREQPEGRFALRQTIFSGFKEFSALAGFKKEGERDTLRLQRARREVFLRTAASFYNVLGRETEAANTTEGLDLAQDRVKELRGFRKLGKARESELFTAQAHAAALRAALRQSQAQIASAREELSFLTGQDLTRRPLGDDLAEAAAPPPVENALAQAQDRADVRAMRADAEAADRRIKYEKGAYLPSLDLLGKYYTRRATFLSAIDWDVTLSLSVPLFQGGRVNAAVDRAKSAKRQSELMLSELQRQIAYEVRRLHGDLTASVEEAQAQEESAQAAQKSYDALREEYKLGLVTNLDVLQALDLLLSQRGARDAARLDVKRLFIQLGVATETLP